MAEDERLRSVGSLDAEVGAGKRQSSVRVAKSICVVLCNLEVEEKKINDSGGRRKKK